MGWPQVTLIALATAGVAISAVKHGQPRENYNWLVTVAATAIMASLLYAGGFFG